MAAVAAIIIGGFPGTDVASAGPAVLKPTPPATKSSSSSSTTPTFPSFPTFSRFSPFPTFPAAQIRNVVASLGTGSNSFLTARLDLAGELRITGSHARDTVQVSEFIGGAR